MGLGLWNEEERTNAKCEFVCICSLLLLISQFRKSNCFPNGHSTTTPLGGGSSWIAGSAAELILNVGVWSGEGGREGPTNGIRGSDPSIRDKSSQDKAGACSSPLPRERPTPSIRGSDGPRVQRAATVLSNQRRPKHVPMASPHRRNINRCSKPTTRCPLRRPSNNAVRPAMVFSACSKMPIRRFAFRVYILFGR
jgi:hypothetical protein